MSLAQSLILFAVCFHILGRKVVIGIQMKECGSTFFKKLKTSITMMLSGVH